MRLIKLDQVFHLGPILNVAILHTQFQTGALIVKDVPFELKGRQRAEFTVNVVDSENLDNRAEVQVSVDLILPDSSSEQSSKENDGKTTGTGKKNLIYRRKKWSRLENLI